MYHSKYITTYCPSNLHVVPLYFLHFMNLRLVVVNSNITNDLHKHNMANYSFEMMFYKYTQYVLFNEGNSDTEMVDVKK